jgi:hypothetical protein
LRIRRIATERGRPPGFAAGIKGDSTAHAIDEIPPEMGLRTFFQVGYLLLAFLF